jgi:hypothetical protein
MSDKDIDLRSVNWEHGMLLTPTHLLRQERYMDSMLLWVLRYGSEAYGLIGGGARIAPDERGTAKHDPIINVHDDGMTVTVSVTQCRGLSPSGDIIDVDPSQAIHQRFSKLDLEGHSTLGIYVVCVTHDKVIEETLEDRANPQMRSSRRHHYRVALGITGDEASHSLMLGQLRKSDSSLRYEKLSGFIPVCTTLVGHSELMHVWQRLSELLAQLADRYTQLHKAIVEYISMASQRGISTSGDSETLQFVGRMVVTLESCTYEILNPLQSPQRFFQQLYRVIRSAAVYLDLSPPTQDYFRELAEAGETEFGSLLEQERQTLLTNRELTIHDNLSVDAQRIEQALRRLHRLEEALEGKYLDFRVSTALEALNFFFDRQYDPPALFQSTAKPARPQAFGDELTFVFAPLKLEGRHKYRLVLIGMPEARFETDDNPITAEIRLNSGAGQPLRPIYNRAFSETPNQRNFAIDFDAPSDVQTISDLRVIVNAAWPIKNSMLYVRRLLQPVAVRTSPAELASSELARTTTKEPTTDVRRPRLSRPGEPSDEHTPGPAPKPPRRSLE